MATRAKIEPTSVGIDPDAAKPSLGASAIRFLIGVGLITVMGVFLVAGFLFLRDSTLPNWVIAISAIIWGLGGAALLFWVFNWVIEQFSDEWTARLQPFVFVGPAIFLLAWYLAIPSLRTFIISLYDRDGVTFIGLQNYLTVFTDRQMIEAFRNNLMWIVFGTSISVIFGLLIAVLADRSNAERTAKSFIFLPMAISFVGAGVIWKFMYAIRPEGIPQIGILNALVVAFGGQPQAWFVDTNISPWNNIFLIVIMGWLQTGFAMVIFSAALKGISTEIIEAARVDGAGEVRIFFQIMIPAIQGTIITVTTTILIFALKIFDIVWVMAGGQFGTEVIATAFYRQSFVARNAGLGSAIAVVLLITVVPVMIYNLRQFGKEQAF
jgi:alpha-glucoside transport system permease protein